MVHRHDKFCIYDGRRYRYINRYPPFTVKTAEQTKRGDTLSLPDYDPDYCNNCKHIHPWTGHKWLCSLEGCGLYAKENDRPKAPLTTAGKLLKVAENTARLIGPPHK